MSCATLAACRLQSQCSGASRALLAMIRGADGSLRVASGITAIELAEMRPPHWELKPALRALFKIPSAPPPVLSNPEVWSEEFADMLRHCLIKDPDARLSAAQLLETPFCTKVGGPTKIREVLQPLAVEVMASPLCPVNGEAGAAPAKDASATLPAGSGVEPRDRTLVRAGATRECAGGTLRPGQGAESVTTNAVDAAESAQLLEHGATAELTRTLRLSEAERLRESIALIRGEGVNIESGPQPPLGGPIDFSDGPVTPPEARLSTTAASTSAGTATIARYAGEWMDGREERGLEAHVERGLSFWEVRDDGARGSSAQPSRYHEAGDDESRTEAFPWMSPEQIAALSEEDCVQFAMCALHMSPWDGSEPFERIIGEESSTMTPRRVTLCERIAFGGPPVLLTLLFRMLTEARIATDNASRDANVPVARSLSENEPPVTSSSLGATTADGLKADTADSAASDAGERARAAAGATITASYQAELKVQRIVLKVLLIVARNAPSESIFRDQSLRETLFGLALTHDYEVRLMAVEVLRELAESDLDAARYMCSTEAMQGVLALCASAASTPASEQGLLAALELLETLLSTLIPSVPGSDVSRLRDVLPEGLEPVLNIVEEQVEPDSAAYALARDMRAYLDIEDRNYVGGPSSYLPGRRASFGNALGGLLNRAFPGGSLGKKP